MGIGIAVTPGSAIARHRDGFEIRIEEACRIVSNTPHKMEDNRIEDGGDKENNSDNDNNITNDCLTYLRCHSPMKYGYVFIKKFYCFEAGIIR